MRKNILIVEDSPTQAQMAKMILENEGYDVYTAENGEVGLKMAIEKQPDLIIADIIMPIMDGYEMIKRLRHNTTTSSIPILILTTKDKPMDIMKGLEVGADYYLTKPYEEYDLVSSVENIFKGIQGESQDQSVLKDFDNEILITRTRKQILEKLLFSISKIIDCDLMSLVIFPEEVDPLFFIISFYPVDNNSVETIIDKVSLFLNQIMIESVTVPKSPNLIVTMDKPKIALNKDNMLKSFLHVPLILDKQIIGVLSIFSHHDGAFNSGNIRFLFDIGTKAASTLIKVRPGE